MTYDEALAEARKTGVGKCSDAAAMAAFCEAPLPILAGAVSPRLVWEGAMARGMKLTDLARRAGDGSTFISDLQWEGR